jgi:hypothetical protein
MGHNCYQLGALALALSACTAILDFSEPVNKTDAAPEDAAVASDAGTDATPAVCTTFEPNESIAAATSISAMDVASAICSSSDLDFFRFAVLAGQDVTITLNFTAAGGDDLDLRLLDSDGAVISSSTGTSSPEEITRTLADGPQLAEGTYHIEVVGTSVGPVVPYSINLMITTP